MTENQTIQPPKEGEVKTEPTEVWLSCMIRKTPRGYSIWIPDGAFK